MKREDARIIAGYAIPRILAALPQETKLQLLRPEEGERTMLDRLVEQGAKDIQWGAFLVKQEGQARYV